MKHQRGGTGASLLAEMKDFAALSAEEQRYVCRSLDVAAGHKDAMKRWARDPEEARSIRDQARIYRRLDALKQMAFEDREEEFPEVMMAPLFTATAFDMSQSGLRSLSSYRFLYERLLGAWVRPWLVTAFCAAATLPHLHPERRGQLLKSIDEDQAMAVGWSPREPAFFPQSLDDTSPAWA